MHIYFIDDWTSEKKYRRETDNLDMMLTQYGLTGRRVKLSRLYDLEAGIREAARSGIKTFVAVGNDNTASRLLNIFVRLTDIAGAITQNKRENEVLIQNPAAGACLAILPIGRENQQIAAALGGANLFAAVAALRQRRTAIIDLACLNNRHYFVTAAYFGAKVSLGFSKYSVSSLRPEHEVAVGNVCFPGKKNSAAHYGANPSDGILEAAIIYQKPAARFGGLLTKRDDSGQYGLECLFPVTKVRILSSRKTITVLADVAKQLTAPVRVEAAPQALRVVVGAGFGK